MKKNIISLVLILLSITAILSIIFLKKQKKYSKKVAESTKTEKVLHLKKGNIKNIFDVTWILKLFGKKDTLKNPITKAQPTIFFSIDKVYGNTGCNDYSFDGKIKVEDDKLIMASGVLQTEMGCDPEIMEQESIYLKLLGQAESFDAYKEKLIIYCTGENLLIFERLK